VLEKECDEICNKVRRYKCSSYFSSMCVLDLKIAKLRESQ